MLNSLNCERNVLMDYNKKMNLNGTKNINKLL